MIGAARDAALVALALGLALWRPVETFVLAFVVLGPLHYLTELAWLQERGWFVQDRAGAGALGALGVTGTAMAIALESGAAMPGRWAPVVQLVAVSAMAVSAFVATALVVAPGRPSVHGGVGVGAALLGAAWGSSPWARSYFVAFGVLLPTVVHVLVFTACFMLSGCLRRKTAADRLALGAFVGALGVLALDPIRAPTAGTPWAREAWSLTLGYLPVELLDLVGPRPAEAGVLGSAEGAAVVRLLSFAWLHHYLNWFAKTRRVGVDKLPVRRLASIAVLWCGLMSLFWFDFGAGLLVAMLPNVLHVVLELPLNVRVARELLGAGR